MTTSATPATPTSPTISSEIQAIEKKVGIWLDPAHIVLTALLGIALLAGTYFFMSKRAEVAEVRAQAAAQVAEIAKQAAITSEQKNEAQQAESKATIAQMAAANQILVTANTQLQAANNQLISTLAAQKKKDAAMPPTEQAQRWSQLVPGTVVQVVPSGFQLDQPSGLLTLNALEELSSDRQTIQILQAEVQNDEKQIANDAVSFRAEQTAHSSDLANSEKKLVAALDDNKKVLAEYNAYKKKAHKNYIKIAVVCSIFGYFAKGGL
jgi:hypothetical protein